ncbi:hypothetical protein TCAL_03871 [Tigriopus californicus]|uniref:CUB domain-containing protein n=1 Tax=Tigriopus californicus TaxID=6832 RepID=A0A553PH23_TIGCA|nr:uncharacterized protein LOC131881016 [Tigriopus californicus]TRY76988.1 hypothetical protein TCAL_03871 [Tigriopus californicus]
MGVYGVLCLFLAVHLDLVTSNLTKKIKVIDGFVSSKNNLVDINEVLLFRIGTRQIDFTINVQEQDPSLQNCSGRRSCSNAYIDGSSLKGKTFQREFLFCGQYGLKTVHWLFKSDFMINFNIDCAHITYSFQVRGNEVKDNSTRKLHEYKTRSQCADEGKIVCQSSRKCSETTSSTHCNTTIYGCLDPSRACDSVHDCKNEDDSDEQNCSQFFRGGILLVLILCTGGISTLFICKHQWSLKEFNMIALKNDIIKRKDAIKIKNNIASKK